MFRKAVELLLIAGVLVGGVLAWRTGRERARLAAEYARLARAAGDLTITDPTKIHVLAIDTGEPLHYAWRIYLPLNVDRKVFSRFRSMELLTASKPEEFVMRVRIRRRPDLTGLQIYERGEFGINESNLGEERLANLVLGHEGEMQVEQLGSGGVAVIEPDQTPVMLRLAMPPGMQAKALHMLDAAEQKSLIPELYRWEIGPDKSKARPALAGGSAP
jgi:hypothetical protein